jgi:hypothetical protein
LRLARAIQELQHGKERGFAAKRPGVAGAGSSRRPSQRRLRVVVSFARLAIAFQLGWMGGGLDQQREAATAPFHSDSTAHALLLVATFALRNAASSALMKHFEGGPHAILVRHKLVSHFLCFGFWVRPSVDELGLRHQLNCFESNLFAPSL